MDVIYQNSISAISMLQNKLPGHSNLMFAISNIFDPRYAFLFFSPLIYSLDKVAGRKLMLVSVVAEWSNQILKWMLHGERPYWWIHETEVYNRTSLPDVRQFVCTCETGPGSPSGHAMVTASVWYIIIETLLQKMNNGDKLTSSKLINNIAWLIYTSLIAIVSLSRVYIAAHFPHQCLLGGVIGVIVAMIVSNFDTSSLQRSTYIKATIGLFLSVFTTYSSMRILGMNPMWSVDRALKWCVKREYVHLDTSPFFSVMRYIGFFFGMGIGLTSKYAKSLEKAEFSTEVKLLIAALSIGTSRALEFVPLLKTNIYTFYISALAINALLPYLFIAIVPYVVCRILPPKVKSH